VERKKLDMDGATKVVVELLENEGPMTTLQIEARIMKRGEECPDTVVLFLTKLRMKRVIKGEVSEKYKGFLWWVGER
jgi:hypothetical protein